MTVFYDAYLHCADDTYVKVSSLEEISFKDKVVSAKASGGGTPILGYADSKDDFDAWFATMFPVTESGLSLSPLS